MTMNIGGMKYMPGMYSTKRPTGAQLAENYFRNLDHKLIEKKKEEKRPEIYPCISFSRKIGVGAMEVAEILTNNFNYSIVNRNILEYIAAEANLSQKTVAYYDERYPGKINEFVYFLFGEKSFIKSDFTKHLFSSVLSIAGIESTIFLGRGTHLILPRERTLAVRLICSDEYRNARLAKILGISNSEARNTMAEVDEEQTDFLIKAFGKKEVVSYDFDLVINFDWIKNVQSAAKIVELAFQEKFSADLDKSVSLH